MTSIRIAAAALSLTLISTYAASTNNVGMITQQEMVEAALYGKADTIDQGLKQGIDINQADAEKRTVLMFAAFNGQTAIVKKLIDAGAEVNAQDQIGTSALMFAASGPSSETVQVLLDAGAKINMVDNNEHFSALMWAAAEGQADNVKLLLKNGADTSLKDIDGDSAASFASKAGHTQVVEILNATAETDSEKKDAETKAE